jgi:3-hydroxyacyl-CoA dehydrogenase
MITIGIIGNGFVGNATSQFENENVKVLIYDVSPEKCKPP